MDFAQTDARPLMGTTVEIAAETAPENSVQSDVGTPAEISADRCSDCY